MINGGGGDDLISATAITDAEQFALARNILDGGSGDDTIQSVVQGSSNSPPTDVSDDISGRSGDDVITSDITASNFEENGVDLSLDGGGGQDQITSDISVIDGQVTLGGVIKGGGGNDVIQSNIDLDISNSFFSNTFHDVTMALDGGAGDDAMTLTVNVASYDPTASDVWSFDLTGGAGDDTISASISNGVDAGFRLDGGSGDDMLMVTGGQGNVLLGGFGSDMLSGGANTDTLDGGKGKDTLEGGLGDDFLTGGARADEFVFMAGTNEGTDHITDWETGQDILIFTGLTDTGAAGLADDIDAVSTITDDGTDVVLELDWGTMLVFDGAGTGSVGSIADLMSDPLNQLA